jgi:hypothetical protein
LEEKIPLRKAALLTATNRLVDTMRGRGWI